MIALTVLSRVVAPPLLAGACLCAAPAGAQVYQLDSDGAVLVRQGSGLVQWRYADKPDKPGSVLLNASPNPISLAVVDTSSVVGQTLLEQAAAQAGLSPAVLEALVWQESRWRQRAISRKGAIGLTQLMPDTARALGVNPYDPVANLFGGARYLRSMLDRFDGNLVKALAAYNAGARRVEQADGVPPIRETQIYVASIMNRLGLVATRQ